MAGSLIGPYSAPEEVLHCFQIWRPTVLAVDAATAPTVISARKQATNPPDLISLDDEMAETQKVSHIMFHQLSLE